MAHILVSDAQAWLEGTKMNLTQLDTALEKQVSTEILGKLAETYGDPAFGTPTWIDELTTPELVKQAISMEYAGWMYDRQYSEVLASEGTSYGLMLRQYSETLVQGIVDNSITIVEVLPNLPQVAPVFYPNDNSSTTQAQLANSNPDDKSVGPAFFGTFKVF